MKETLENIELDNFLEDRKKIILNIIKSIFDYLELENPMEIKRIFIGDEIIEWDFFDGVHSENIKKNSLGVSGYLVICEKTKYIILNDNHINLNEENFKGYEIIFLKDLVVDEYIKKLIYEIRQIELEYRRLKSIGITGIDKKVDDLLKGD